MVKKTKQAKKPKKASKRCLTCDLPLTEGEEIEPEQEF